MSSYEINILGREQKELFGGVGTNSSMQYPLLKKIPILKTQQSPRKLTMPMYVLVLWLYYIQILHRGKESHIACRSTLEVKLVCTNMMMLRSSHLHSSCLLTRTYILYTVYYVLSMVYMFEYSRLIMHAIEFLERWNFNYCHLESGYVSCIHYTVGYRYINLIIHLPTYILQLKNSR